MTYVQRLGKRIAFVMKNRHGGPLEDYRLKTTSKLFAAKHGLRVPKLLYAGFGGIPWHLLPDSFVIKPNGGSECRAVFLVDKGTEVFSNKPIDRRKVEAALKHDLIVIEELVRDVHDNKVPTDYKLFGFKDEVPAILAMDRTDKAKPKRSWFTADWKPRSPINHSTSGGVYAEHGHFPKPPHLEEMIQATTKLTTAANTFLRIDLFDTPTGPVFGETTICPNGGRAILVDANQELGELWGRKFGMAF